MNTNTCPNICPNCGARLDADEICDCQRSEEEASEEEKGYRLESYLYR